MDGWIGVALGWSRSIVTRFGLLVSSLAIAVWPSSAHVMAFSKNNSSSCLALALAFLAATRLDAWARNLLVYAWFFVGIDGASFNSLVSVGSAAKAGNVA
jgi:hypothetical protein